MAEGTIDAQQVTSPQTLESSRGRANSESVPQQPKAKTGFIQKSPQELAAQVESVSNILYGNRSPKGEVLRERYKNTRTQIEGLLERGLSNEELGQELDRIYKQGRRDGSYDPTVGENANEFITAEKERLIGFGFSAEEAETRARQDLSREGYLGELRSSRRRQEDEINKRFSEYDEAHPLTPEENAERMARLKEGVIVISDPEQAKRLAENFPGGNFLYHGTEVTQAISILDSGELLNAKALADREETRVASEGGEKKLLKRNSGYEGISWNYREIGAMPGDRYHLVGFLASPVDVLTDGRQLAIPSRPAPHELILMDGDIDANHFYVSKTQQELIASISMGDTNSVLSNISNLSSFREAQASGSSIPEESILNNFSKSGLTDQEMRMMLKSMYSARDNGTIELSPDLLQQAKNDIPVAAVWFQALIDTGRIKNVKGFEDITTVRETIERITPDNSRNFYDEIRTDNRFLAEEVKSEDDKVGSISVPTSDAYLVIPNTDLDRWLGVLARTKVQPKGIVVYDHMAVRLENFASMHRGDNQGLTDILQSAIPPTEGHIDYESQILGEEITPNKMVGYRKHVIAEKHLEHRKVLRKDPQGNLVVA